MQKYSRDLTPRKEWRTTSGGMRVPILRIDRSVNSRNGHAWNASRLPHRKVEMLINQSTGDQLWQAMMLVSWSVVGFRWNRGCRNAGSEQSMQQACNLPERNVRQV